MVVANAHGPNYHIFWKFILNCKIFNTHLFFVIFGKFWWISRCVYLILKTFVKQRRNFLQLLGAWIPIPLKWKEFWQTKMIFTSMISLFFLQTPFRMESFIAIFLIKLTVLSICHISIPRETIFMTTLLA